ncbi:cation:proton antiporter domain-containing protein [Roseitranquillus sediminis]|uniref:cation:proton antiporter domain-containing protein n=1 Tax=Roseitranquillus sediminis TaxID=2809051 RepID=UPI001D0C512D|nr:cation:proton antiporter [Roseitranquillus sediminis]MBM9595813.1 cation:proton antiporter [Roseitranquillus sediminis]
MQQLDATVTIAAAAVVLLGLASRRVQMAPVSRPLLALAVGILAGPQVAGLLRPDEWPSSEVILREAARFTLAISVFGIALRTPRESYTRLARPVAVLLSLGMLVMWGASFGAALLLGVAPVVALAAGAVVTPTDPVVASAIATGGAAERHLPEALRSTLSLESGANDGLGYLFVMLPVLIVLHPADAGARWFWDVLVVGVLLAVAIGAATGLVAARLLRLADRSEWIERHSLLGLSIALSLMVLAMAHLAGSDGILAAFVAGVAFNMGVDRDEDHEQQNVQETIAKLFNLPVFVLLGAALPWREWAELGWPVGGFAVAVLLLRRPLALAVCGPLLGGRLSWRDVGFLGWFGPVGVAALYYALLVKERTGDPTVWPAAALVIVLSVVAHGVTSGPGLRAYSPGRQVSRRR